MSLYKLSERIFELEKQGRMIVKLNIGNPGLPTPALLVQAAEKAIADGKTFYASGQGEKKLLEKIASMHGAEVKNATVTPGSKWAIYGLMKILLQPGDNIVTPGPFWSAFELIAKNLGGSCKLVKTHAEDRWNFEPDALIEAVDSKTKLIIVNSPLNPTSTEYDTKDLRAVYEYAQDKKIQVLVDEAYRDLSFQNTDLTHYEEYVNVTNTFSKAYCMSGWRAGYLVASEELSKKLVELNQITFTNVPLFTQAAMLAGLENRQSVTKATRDACASRLKMAEEVFDGIEYVKPDAGFYMFLKCPGKNGGKVAEAALEKGVAIVPGANFGGYNEYVRISLSHPEAVLQPALEKVRQAMDENG
ncbi:pyridoxal phosphate-dependent aminotransferase [Candidatus Micrarchaeota archaeon]|nr:pyridoxal phosphate-dependent aminotransferase [Candidatus Micrarchaeota archaeon]